MKKNKAPAKPINLYDLERGELEDLIAGWGFSQYHAGRIWHYLYRQHVSVVGDMLEIRHDLLEPLVMETVIGDIQKIQEIASTSGHTRKFLLRSTGRKGESEDIETVLMHFTGRATACISTQVGCAMGCVFCATGQMGFVRHLSAGEMVAQVVYVIRVLKQEEIPLRNLVFMGMGEPLHNYEETMKAVDILTEDSGLAIGPRYITISTVGLPKGIRRMADEDRPVNLAVSLHAATDDERSAIVPVNKRWPLDEILAACHYYAEKRQRRIFFEWALIAGENDGPDQAHALGRLLAGLDGHVNLIPLNPTAGFDGRPSKSEHVRAFQSILGEYGLPSTVRQRRGIDINAGCGQLRTLTPAVPNGNSS